MDNDDSDIFDGDDATDGDGSGSGSEGSAPPDGGTDAGDASNSDQRIRDLTSKWQKEEARANRAEAQLRARGGADSAGDGDKAGAVSDPEVEAFKAFMRDAAREQLFKSEPRLAQFGIKPESITGATPEEMRASLGAQVKLLDSLESQIRNQVLSEHGIAPAIADGGRGEKLPDFTSMSSEEFEKYVQRLSR